MIFMKKKTGDHNVYCSLIKYWLYEKIQNINPKRWNIKKYFKICKDKLVTKLGVHLLIPWTFYELHWNDLKKISEIYTFAIIYYKNLNTFKPKYNIEWEFFDNLGKGLKAYYESPSTCPMRTKALTIVKNWIN